ncbi:GNAT family N-acetyltransferase [Kutzneria buriramensis]|uniref:Ribosomal protein S18 acetylase RimI-like enzyme n=1 Tax=Kutzneria buriramensis TaxID=1045776 RepID=A0A3E0H457_9PSEU|nr:GNAT family N-acetyltransferase [Kutzneria buriramensis]REH37115.1 ribosomal protein S18 acetylase RimI-like enzyme [Kutzneria buriramensis]
MNGTVDVVFKELTSDDVPLLRSDLLPLLRRLRPAMSDELFAELVTDGFEQGLRYLVAYSPSGLPLAAAGYRILVTSRGRVLFVDDLVTAEESRSRGFGARVVDELTEVGRRAGCDRMELDSGVVNTAAHRFYLRHRFDISAFHFARPIAP